MKMLNSDSQGTWLHKIAHMISLSEVGFPPSMLWILSSRICQHSLEVSDMRGSKHSGFTCSSETVREDARIPVNTSVGRHVLRGLSLRSGGFIIFDWIDSKHHEATSKTKFLVSILSTHSKIIFFEIFYHLMNTCISWNIACPYCL